MTCIGVTVAGLWTGVASARDIDAPALGAPVDMERWLASLDDASRLALCDDKRLATQALLDTPVEVIERTQSADGIAWSRVVVPSQPCSLDPRGYPGWLPTAQLADGPGHGDCRDDSVFVSAPTAWLRREDKAPVKLSFATRLTLTRAVNDRASSSDRDGNGKSETRVGVESALGRGWLPREDVYLPGDSVTQDAATLERLGRRFAGLRYLWAGNSGFGFDCSGFVHSLFAAIGVTLPRDASDQVNVGEAVDIEQRCPGDLLYFEKPDAAGISRVDHVALYLGEDRMLHAPTNNARIECRRLAGTRYARELCAVRRYIG